MRHSVDWTKARTRPWCAAHVTSVLSTAMYGLPLCVACGFEKANHLKS